MPEGVPEPETLTSAKQLMEPFAEKSSYAKYYAEKSPFDIRHVTRTIMLGADKKSASNDSGKQMVWMKADGTVDVPQVMHRAMLAMGCDQVMLEPVLRRAGLSIATCLVFRSLRSIIRCGGIAISTSISGICMCRIRLPRLTAVVGTGEGIHAGWRACCLHDSGGDDSCS